MSDIVQELRDRAYAFKFPDQLVVRAADEIERLRAAARLSEPERLALTMAVDCFKRVQLRDDTNAEAAAICSQLSAAIWRLLERLE